MVATVAIGGVLAANAEAMADSVTSAAIEFNGTISNTCAVSQSFGDASINLTCNGDTQVAVTNFQDVIQPTGIALNKAYKWNEKNIDLSNQVSNSIMLLSGPVDQKITVKIDRVNNNALKSGAYQHTSQLTVTVQ
jgi:di/tripeptidase